MTQPRRNVGSHGNPFWVLCSDGCRGCYRWSGCGRASPGNALKMVCIFAAYLAEEFFFLLLSALWSCASVGDQLSVCPGSQRDPLAPGTRASRLLLALPRGQWEQKQQHRQGSKTRYNFPFRLRSAGAPRACSPRLIHALLVLTAPLPILGAVRSLGKPGQLRASAQLHWYEGSYHFIYLVSSVKTWRMCKCHHSGSSHSLPGPRGNRVQISPVTAQKYVVGRICLVCKCVHELRGISLPAKPTSAP